MIVGVNGDVVIPDGVRSIGDYSFPDCTGLVSVIIPSSVTNVGVAAFAYCSALETVTIPSGVTSVGDWAFYNCGDMRSVTISSSVSSIGQDAFYGCDKLAVVYVVSGDTKRVKRLYPWPSTVKFVEFVPPSVDNDPKATVSGNPASGFLVMPSADVAAVVVSLPQGVAAEMVTAVVSPNVVSVKPNGAKVKVFSRGADITPYLDIPGTARCADGSVIAAQTEGVIDLTQLTVKESVVKGALNPANGAVVCLNASAPVITTAVTIPGFTYTFREGTTMESLGADATPVTYSGDGGKWTLPITVMGGDSAFYSLGVSVGE